jgi:hypothetical protein
MHSLEYYILYDAYSDHITASENFGITTWRMCMLGTHITFRIHSAAGSELWNRESKVSQISTCLPI